MVGISGAERVDDRRRDNLVPMNIRQSVFGEIVTRSGQQIVGIDQGTLLRRLLLFDSVVIRSASLREIPLLIRAFGKSGFLQLFDSGILKVSWEAMFLITGTARNGVPSVPPCHFTFGIGELAEREKHLRKYLAPLQGIPGLGNSERQAMEECIINGLVRPPSDYGAQFQAQVESDLRSNSPALRVAIERKLAEEVGQTPTAPKVRVEETEPKVFRVVTDIGDVYGFSEAKTHEILQSSVGALANLNQRIADMAAYSSITGFADSDASILFGKFAGIISPQNPEPIEKQFARVVTLADLPDLTPGRRVDVDKLLRARESTECLEFRTWLSKLEGISDKDITDLVNGLRNRVGFMAQSGPGKVLRFAVTAALGLIPVAGLVAGPVAGAVDSFLVDKIFPSSGVVAFLTQTYPSLFERL